ncbi:MAG: type II secretion system F family protein [Aestuariivirga sp.]|uniref:type II secretion system F family protein n=1 Tax=Aestuariivirga sp. TaxID=2650926 RepID=UPI0025C25315|nr:type II secretion system F family protein [Aestuariivirga sp.]MCA3561114.1 type II secretion system F family protein [Aestuariivirga sp.]
MASFRYSAIRDSGERVAGIIEGADRSLAISRLSEQGLHPIDIREDDGSGATAFMSFTGSRIPRAELTGFTRQLAWLLQAGTSLNRSLEILSGETFSKPLAAALGDVSGAIRKGRSFHDALEETGAFPPFYLSMVEVGEATGTLGPVLDRLATAREREQKVRGKVTSALVYPVMLVVLSIGVVIFLMVSVVPGIKDMISSSGAPIPDSAKMVLNASDWLIANGLTLAAAAALAVLAMGYLWTRSALPRLMRDLALRLPLLGKLLLKSEVAQFCRLLGTLSAAGMNLQASLKLIASTSPDRRILGAAEQMEVALRRGEDFVEPLERSKILPPLLARMIKVGAETGNLTPSLLRVTDILDDELDRLTDRTVSLLGPVIILGLSVFVGFIITSLMSAVISINDLAL